MDKPAVRVVLEQIAASLALKGDNPFRIRAFENAARAIAGYPGDLAEALQSGALAEVEGVGKATLDIVRELLSRGRSSVLDELREEVAPGLVEMLKIPGLGVQKVRQIHEHLHIATLAELEVAAHDGRLAAIPRFGAKTAENVLKGIAFLKRTIEFRLFHHALAEATALQQALGALSGAQRVEIAGSVRRRREVIRDLDFVVVHAGDGTRETLVKRLGEAPGVTGVAEMEGMVTLRFDAGTPVDVVLATPDQFGLAWVRATGAAAHWEELRARGLDAAGRFPDEESVYRALGLTWIPPELREGAGECDAAAAGTLPRLIEARDVKGFVHCHSNYSDGTVTIAEWAHAAKEAGYEWIGLTDHSQSAPFAMGLRPDAIGRQHAEIDRVNAEVPGIRVLKGVESDILADGRLDYDQGTLDRFDFAIGSIHSRFGLDEAEMTKRVLTAMDDPHLAILGHPTGRLLLSRESYPLDFEAVFRRAAERGIAIEVNADPHRLDLDWRLVRRARALGVRFSIGPDAHSVAGMANMEIGLGITRKGWLEATDVWNTLSADEFLAAARRRLP
ncbi:MAG: histidinol-phosphatase [Gemmatimonadetes bacterium]|nr:MAG: histidinol-phosphatase [Gemmatimonadota bacterium]